MYLNYANYGSLIAGGFDLKKFPVIWKKDLLVCMKIY